MKYSKVINISSYKSVKVGIKKIIDIIEPIEKLINLKNKAIHLIDNILELKYKEATGFKNQKHKVILSDYLFEKNTKVPTENIIPTGVGYEGFTKKRGKISDVSKLVEGFDLVVGLSSKDIPIGLNINQGDLGVSIAYHVFSNSKLIIATWFAMKYIKNNWENLIKPTSRQGQSFDSKKLLSTEFSKDTFKFLIEYENQISELLLIKSELVIQVKNANSTLKKAIDYLIQ